MRSEIRSLGEAEQRRLEEEEKEKAAEDARIQEMLSRCWIRSGPRI